MELMTLMTLLLKMAEMAVNERIEALWWFDMMQWPMGFRKGGWRSEREHTAIMTN